MKFKVGDKVKIKKEKQCKSPTCPCSSKEFGIIEKILDEDITIYWENQNRTLNVFSDQVELVYQTQSQKLNIK